MRLFTTSIFLLLAVRFGMTASNRLSNGGYPVEDAVTKKNGSSRPVVLRAGQVSKLVVSSKMRMSILVGLEGSGHHYLIEAINNMFTANTEITVDRTPCIDMLPFHTISFLRANNASRYTQSVQATRDTMRGLTGSEKSLPWPGHLVRLCKEQSYPSGNGPNKVMRYIDLRLLAEMAESEGIDLRVIYLKRSVLDLLVADTVHRRFQNHLGLEKRRREVSPYVKFMEYMVILFTDIAVVHSLLAEIDPAFIVCHDYAHAGEKDQVSRIAQFVAPNNVVKDMLESSLLSSWTPRTTPKEELPVEGVDAMVARLQRKLDVFEWTYCRH